MVAAAETEAERNHCAASSRSSTMAAGSFCSRHGPCGDDRFSRAGGRQGAQCCALQEAYPGAGGGINHGRYAAITARGFIEMQGGLPVVVDGEVIGGIGASFATPEEDEQVAKAGLAALTQ